MDYNKIWKTALGELEVTLSKANFTTWFRDTFIAEVAEDGAVSIGVPNSFTKEWLENKYHNQIKTTLQKMIPQLKEITYRISANPAAVSPSIELSPKTSPALPDNNQPSPANTTLNAHYTLDSFVVGNSNRLAHAVSCAVAKNPGAVHNPLFIYGGVGLGKTHLIQAIGNEIYKNNPKKRVVYVPCERFTNEFIQSIAAGTINQFKKTYRGVDVFLVDDIQFLSKKEGTQEEFFHTFNALHQTNRQIVVTSDRVPRAIPALEERLTSRFGWGMVADIQPPDLETRRAILDNKCQEKKYQLPQEVLDYVAQHIQSNIRELEGALNQIAAHCQLYNILPSLEMAGKVLENIIDKTKNKSLSATKVLSVIADFFNISKTDLLSPSRNQDLVYPRQITMYILRHEVGLSFPKISHELNKKDHTTIIYGCNKISREISRNDNIQRDLTMIKEKLYLI